MRKVLMFIAFFSLLFLYGCGEKENDTIVKVEIETIAVAEPVPSIMVESGTASESKSDEENITASDSSDKSLPQISVAYYGVTAKEILEQTKAELEPLGYNLVLLECSDFTKPNEMVQSGEADASLCENQAFLDSYNLINNTELAIVERMYTEPYAIFPGKTKELNHLANGITIVIPAGETERARALHLLEQKGIIELKAGSGYQACPDDIEKSPYGIKLEPVNFENGFPDRAGCDLIVCDYNHALLEGISPDEALGYENRNSEMTDLFAVCLVSSNEKRDSDKISKLCKAMNCESVETYIEENFYHAVVDYR